MRFTSTIAGVIESPLVQIATLAESMPGSIKLCYGESDMPTPEFISRASYEAMLPSALSLVTYPRNNASRAPSKYPPRFQTVSRNACSFGRLIPFCR